MRVLGIETSCDDTCAAVVENGRQILSSVVASQEQVHAKYGGIVPELASRRHLECILPVIREALEQADCSLDDIDAIAVTQGPGLIGSLLVGLSTAKAMAYGRDIPLAAVHHLRGHLMSPRLNGEKLPDPHIALVISGGHTALYRVDSPLDVTLIGATRDDAAGEAFDKVGKILGLPYPGGPQIEKQARGYQGEIIPFPRARFKTGGFQFSFSGLKTAAAQYIEKKRRQGAPVNVAQICASFQEAVIDALAGQCFTAVESEGLKVLAVSGGVASNTALREQFESLAGPRGVRVVFANKKYCTDNAAMIAAVGTLQLNQTDPPPKAALDLNAYARLPLG